MKFFSQTNIFFFNFYCLDENEHNVEAGRETRGSMWSITGNVLPSYDDATKTFKGNKLLLHESFFDYNSNTQSVNVKQPPIGYL